jgi:signal transduction histidine kinase
MEAVRVGRGASKPLNVLLVEDNEDDVELLLRTLRRAGYDPRHQRVETAEGLREALSADTWDIVLTDCQLPQFSGARTINMIRDGMGLDVPIIVVSGAIGEETAVKMIKAGAQDYVLKGKLARLPVAIERELRAAETKRARAASEAERVLDRENFTSIVAHDLRAPVQRIETMVKLLRADYEQVLGDDGQDILVRIERSAIRLRLMLASLLSYSRYGRVATGGKVASLRSAINEVLENVALDRKSADISVELGDCDWVQADGILLGHVIENLIGNAFKFRRKDRLFKLSIDVHSTDAGKIEVSVTDNGIGIEPRFADKVFDIFYRLHDDDEYEGTGIGLAICRKIIQDHGGSIWVDRNYIGGARIVFTLAAADERRETA